MTAQKNNRKKALYPLSSNPFSTSPLLGHWHLSPAFCLYNLPLLNIPHRRNHTVFVFLCCFILFNIMLSVSIHVVTWSELHWFVWLTCHSVNRSHFVYLLIFWWTLSYFHLPTIMSNAAINTGPQESVPLFSVLLDISPEVELLSDVVLLCLTFWGASVFHDGCTILYFHEERTGVPTSPHLHILSNTCYYFLFFVFICVLF